MQRSMNSKEEKKEKRERGMEGLKASFMRLTIEDID